MTRRKITAVVPSRKGLEFDVINENLLVQRKLFGYGPIIMADYFIDNRVLQFTYKDSSK